MRDSVDCLSLLSGMSSHPTWRPQGWSLHAARRQIQEMRGGAGEDADELEDTRRDEQCRGVHEQIDKKHENPFTCGSVADACLETGTHVIFVELHLAVDLAAHGEEQRNHDVRLLEATARLPRHGQEARLYPNVRACNQTHSKVTQTVDIMIIALLQKGGKQWQVSQIHGIHGQIHAIANDAVCPDENAVVDDGVDRQDHGHAQPAKLCSRHVTNRGHLAPGLHPLSLVVMGPHTEGLSCNQIPHFRPIKGIVHGNVGKQLRYSRIVPDNLLCLQEILDCVPHRGWRLFQGLHLNPIREDESRDLDEVRQVPPNTVLRAVHETQHETQDIHAGLQQHLHYNQDLRTVTHLFLEFPGLVLEIREIPGLVLRRQQFLGQPLHMRPSVPKAQRKQKSHVR